MCTKLMDVKYLTRKKKFAELRLNNDSDSKYRINRLYRSDNSCYKYRQKLWLYYRH